MTTDAFTTAARASAEQHKGPRMFVGTCLDREMSAHVDGWRAARDHLAAQEVRGHEHEWRPKQNVTTKGYVMPAYEACTCGAAKEARA